MKKKNYINNEQFENTIKKYLSRGGKKKYEEDLVTMFDTLIDNIINGFSFNVDKEEAKQDCMLLIFKTLKKFKPVKGKAFNYFTTIIVNNLKLIYTKNKKATEKREKYLEDVYHKPRNPEILET